MPEKTTGVIIESARLLDGPQQIAELAINKQLPTAGSTFTQDLTIPAQAQPEIDHQLTLTVWYQYTTSGVTQKGTFQKQIGKFTLLSPE